MPQNPYATPEQVLIAGKRAHEALGPMLNAWSAWAGSDHCKDRDFHIYVQVALPDSHTDLQLDVGYDGVYAPGKFAGSAYDTPIGYEEEPFGAVTATHDGYLVDDVQICGGTGIPSEAALLVTAAMIDDQLAWIDNCEPEDIYAPSKVVDTLRQTRCDWAPVVNLLAQTGRFTLPDALVTQPVS